MDFYFYPDPWRNDPIDDHIFQMVWFNQVDERLILSGSRCFPLLFPNTLECISEVRIIDERETEGEEMISDWKYCMWKTT